MSHAMIPALFLVVAGGIAVLIKWEYKHFLRRQPRESKAFRGHLEKLREAEPGRAYNPLPERTRRSFDDRGGRS
jgi:hypothetical protein